MKVSRRRFNALALCAGGSALASACGGTVDDLSITRESRALFDEQFTWRTAAGADMLLKRTRLAGFNVLMPCVWAGQGISWRSSSEVWDSRVRKSLRAGFDAFGYLLAEATSLGIEVHPWFKLTTRRSDFHPEFYDAGTPEAAFDVHKPDFRRYIAAIVDEFVERYDVDGVNLDYVRSKGMCTSAACIRGYREFSAGRDLRKDLRGLVNYSEAWQNLTAWNSAAVNDLVQRISQSVRRRQPGLLISVDSHTGRPHWRIQGANSVDWANRGWVDVVYNMQYSRAIKQRELDVAVAKLDEPERMVVLNGNWMRSDGPKSPAVPRPAAEVIAALRASQKRYPAGNGVALYSYKYLSDEQIMALAKGPFAVPARPHWPALRGERR